MEQYIKRHEARGDYVRRGTCGGCEVYSGRYGWEDIRIGSSMIFSHRVTP